MTNIYDILEGALEAFNLLSYEERKATNPAQRKSWVTGELMIQNPDMTQAEADQIYDRMVQDEA